MFDSVGDVARKQQTLFMWILWAAVLVFIVVEGVLIYVVMKFRRRPQDRIPRQVHGNRNLEIAWTIAPIIVVAVPTISTLIDLAAPAPEDALHIRVIGHQWWWEFVYPDQDLIIANEVHIPVGRPISMTLESADVIHSFWIPKIVGKVDMIPNRINKLPTFIVPEEAPGIYFGQCAELCGTAHALMKFRVTAQSDGDFQNWIENQKTPSEVPITDPERIGHDLFNGQGLCLTCHTVRGTTAQGKIGPDLTHFGSRSTLGAALLPNTSEHLTQWLEDPEDLKPGNIMARDAAIYIDPNLRLDSEEIESLVSYLKSLK